MYKNEKQILTKQKTVKTKQFMRGYPTVEYSIRCGKIPQKQPKIFPGQPTPGVQPAAQSTAGLW
jgi:hypothetical protein